MIFMISFSLALKKSIQSTLICIDPGHGGFDGGCVAIDGTYEKDINLDISLKLKDILILNGYDVIITRIGDYDLSNDNSINHKREDIIKRCEIINKADLFISIHCNYFSNNLVTGAQVFYSDNKSKILSECIQKSINSIYDNKRSVNKIKNKYILDNTKSIGCIVEVGFLSNKNDLKILTNVNYQNAIALSISEGIIKYLENYK